MKKFFTILICSILIFNLAACGTSKTTQKKETKKSSEKKKSNFTKEGKKQAEALIDQLKAGGIEIDYYISYDETNDLNNNPTYIGKTNFNDKKISATIDKKSPNSGTIEVFNTNLEAIDRTVYIGDNVFDDYGNSILIDNILIRLSKDYTKEDIDNFAHILNVNVYKYRESNEKPKVEEVKSYEIFDYFFHNDTRWNMSYAEGKDMIKFSSVTGGFAPGNSVSKNVSSLEFRGHSGKTFQDEYIFLFINEALKTYWVSFDDGNEKNKDYITLYKDVRAQITSMYGEPTSENYNWTDEAYKSNEADWLKGFQYGYLTIETQWTTLPDKEIVIRWNYSKGMNVIICEKGYIPNL